MRVTLRTVRRNADGAEQLARLRPRGASTARTVQLERLDDLRAHRLHGVERVHRTLKDHRDVDPTMRPHRFLAPGENVDAVQLDAPCGGRARREQPHQRKTCRRLAAARLADESQAFARLEGQGNTLHRVQRPAGRQVEPDVQLVGLQQGAHSASALRPTSGRRRKVCAERWATRSRGLSDSSSACPIRLQARMRSATSTPGGTIAHHAPDEIAAR